MTLRKDDGAPGAAPAARDRGTDAEAAGPRERCDVLVVDDNPINAKLLRLTLSARGYLVRVAADAEAALAHIVAGVPHAVLTDVQLPGMDGLALVRLLRRDPATRHLPIVVVSAFATLDDEARAIHAGADAFLPKPVDTRRVVALVDELACVDRMPAGGRAG